MHSHFVHSHRHFYRINARIGHLRRAKTGGSVLLLLHNFLLITTCQMDEEEKTTWWIGFYSLHLETGIDLKFEWAHERQTNKRIVIETTEMNIETFLFLLQIHSFHSVFFSSSLCKCRWICNFMVKLTDIYSLRVQIYLNICNNLIMK